MLDWTKKFEELDQEFKDEVAEMEEINCYFLINMLGGVVWRYNHDTADGRIESTEDAEQDIMGLRIKQTYVVRQLTRFGLEKPCEGAEKNYAPTDDYQKWFQWWHEYCQQTLSNEEWAELEQKLNKKEDVSAYKPAGHWSDDPEEDE